MNASGFICDRLEPPASFMRARLAASGFWQVSRPARSLDSSDLRCHSFRAVMIPWIAMAPSGIHMILVDSQINSRRMVRYTVWPLST